MLTLEELKNKKDLMSKIRFEKYPAADVFPYEARTQEDIDKLEQILKELEGYYFVINVYNLQARLELWYFGPENMACIDIIEVPEELEQDVINAIYDQGGALNWSGVYPATEKLLEKLKEILNA